MIPTVITRSALVFHGHDPASEVAYVTIDADGVRGVVTWRDVLRDRRECQRRRLLRINQIYPWRAWKLWAAYFGDGLMGGWNAFLDNRDQSIWIDRDNRTLIPHLMATFPLLDDVDAWEKWKRLFASGYKRRVQFRRPVGVCYVWWRAGERPKLVRQAETPT